MKKKIILLLCLLSFSAIPLLQVKAAEDNYSIYIHVPDKEKNNNLVPGDEITYYICSYGYTYTTTEMDLVYDPKYLEVKSITPYEGFKVKEVGNLKNSPIHIKLSDINSVLGIELFRVTFHIREDVPDGYTSFKIQNVIDRNGKKMEDFSYDMFFSVKNKNNKISSIGFDNGNLLSDFSPDKTDYQLQVPKDATVINVSASLEDYNTAKLSGDIGAVSLEGKTELKVTATAENGDSRTYTFHLVRSSEFELDENNYLQSLVPSAGFLSFDPDVLEYDVKVPYTANEFSVQATPQNPNSLVEISGGGDLATGSTTIKVTVTAEDNSQRTYTINVTRDEESAEDAELNRDSSLKKLEVKGQNFTFDPSKYDYDIYLTSFDPLDIVAEANNPKSKVAIQGNKNLKDGSEIYIVVTSESGLNETYILRVVDASVHGYGPSSGSSNQTMLIIALVASLLVVGALVAFLVIKKKKNPKKDQSKPNDKSKSKPSDKSDDQNNIETL